ncbi:MAG: DUF892 family protein [Verrucomicrobiales bacterium]|nr:DUF892 family protein [Verrucomicrobiales bacterium]
MERLTKLFLEQLSDIYDAEQRFTRVLPKLMRHITEEALRDLLHHHIIETEFHVQRLNTIFELCQKPASGRKCHAVVGLIEDAHDLVADHKAYSSINAAIACSVQKIEHYEMATYSCLSEWARQLGLEEASALLLKTLAEERACEKSIGDYIAIEYPGAARSCGQNGDQMICGG